nr:MFS transporter [Leifsonia poae]
MLGWRGLFLVPVAFTLSAAGLALAFIPESSTRAPGGINPWSAVLLSGWLVALLLPLSTGSQWGWSSPLVIGLFAAAAVLLAAWIVVELRSRMPLVDMRMMRLPGVWAMNAAAVFIGAAMFAVFSFFPRFVQTPTSTGYGLGATVAESGLLMLPMLVTMAVTGFLSGPLARYIGFRAQVVIASGVIAVSSVSIGLFHSTLLDVSIEAGVFGIGLGLVYAAISSVVVQSVPPTQTGIASGMNANLRTVGSAIGAALMTAMVTGATGADGLAAESGYTDGFVTAGLLALGALAVTVLSIVLARRARRPVGEAADQVVVTAAESPFAEPEPVLEPVPEPALR